MNLHCTVLTYCTWSRWTLALHFLRHLCKHWYKVLSRTNELWGCKNPVVSLLNTTRIFIRSLRAAVGTPRSCALVHKGEQRKLQRLGRQRLLSVESEVSVLYLLDVLLGTLTNTLRCPGATETQGNASERRTRLHTVVSVLCLKYLRRQARHASFRDKRSAWLGSDIWLAKWS